jgi:hypothetical protein
VAFYVLIDGHKGLKEVMKYHILNLQYYASNNISSENKFLNDSVQLCISGRKKTYRKA